MNRSLECDPMARAERRSPTLSGIRLYRDVQVSSIPEVPYIALSQAEVACLAQGGMHCVFYRNEQHVVHTRDHKDDVPSKVEVAGFTYARNRVLLAAEVSGAPLVLNQLATS